MTGTVQQVIVTGATAGTFSLAGGSELPYAPSASQMQQALQAIFGIGSVIVCSTMGLRANRRPNPVAIYEVMFVGSLWATTVPPLSVANGTNGQIEIVVQAVSHRIIRLFQYTADIYKSIPLRQQPNRRAEAPDLLEIPQPIYTGVPCYYQPTENYAEPKGPGLMKQANLLTADKWHFLVGQELWDRYMIVLRTPEGHALADYGWTVQGNSMVNDAVPGRPVLSQYVLAVLNPLEQIPHAVSS